MEIVNERHYVLRRTNNISVFCMFQAYPQLYVRTHSSLSTNITSFVYMQFVAPGYPSNSISLGPAAYCLAMSSTASSSAGESTRSLKLSVRGSIKAPWVEPKLCVYEASTAEFQIISKDKRYVTHTYSKTSLIHIVSTTTPCIELTSMVSRRNH